MDFKARQLVINPENPFEGDLLGRQGEIENLTTLLSNLTPPMVLAVNGRWGAGKTTFVQMWASHLKLQDFPVLSFNAWATDFSEDPLVAFLGEMNQNLDEYLIGQGAVSESWEKCKKIGGEIAKRSVPALVRIATAGVINVDGLVRDEAIELLGGAAADAVKAYEHTRSSIEEFKESLAVAISEATAQLPLVIFVDELDRCRPTYAIQLLERIKHLFDQPEIIFVLSLDREQLCHSIKAVYGEGLDAAGYLRRFVDVEYTLSSPDPKIYIQQLYKSFGLEQLFKERNKYREFQHDWEHVSNTLYWLCQAYSYSLRDIEQLFARVNLALRATKENQYSFPSLLVFLIALRSQEYNIYYKFVSDEGVLKPVIEHLYSLAPKEVRVKNFPIAVLEGLLLSSKIDADDMCKERYDEFKGVLENIEADVDERGYAETVVEVVGRHRGFRRISLDDLVSRIELISQFNFPQQEASE